MCTYMAQEPQKRDSFGRSCDRSALGWRDASPRERYIWGCCFRKQLGRRIPAYPGYPPYPPYSVRIGREGCTLKRSLYAPLGFTHAKLVLHVVLPNPKNSPACLAKFALISLG